MMNALMMLLMAVAPVPLQEKEHRQDDDLDQVNEQIEKLQHQLDDLYRKRDELSGHKGRRGYDRWFKELPALTKKYGELRARLALERNPEVRAKLQAEVKELEKEMKKFPKMPFRDRPPPPRKRFRGEEDREHEHEREQDREHRDDERRYPDFPTKKLDALLGKLKDMLKEFDPETLLRLEMLRKAEKMEQYAEELKAAAAHMQRLQELKKRDPEHFQRYQLHRSLDREVAGLVKKFQDSDNDEHRARIKSQLHEVLAKQFELHLQNRRAELDKLERRLKDIHRDLEGMSERKSSEVEKRVKEVLKRKKEYFKDKENHEDRKRKKRRDY